MMIFSTEYLFMRVYMCKLRQIAIYFENCSIFVVHWQRRGDRRGRVYKGIRLREKKGTKQTIKPM